MDPSILIIIVFILAPLIERLLKAGKQKPPEVPPRPPQQRMPEQRFPEQRLPEQLPERLPQEERPRVVIARREEESAAEMLPDDLWEILTGERRPPSRGAPPAPEPVEEDEEAWSLEQESEEDWLEETPGEPEVLRFPRESGRVEVPVPRAEFERPVPAREAPRIVSLEQLEFDSRQRHERFHQRIDQLRAQRLAPIGTAVDYRFFTLADARRAIVMSEILGPPKGLR